MSNANKVSPDGVGHTVSGFQKPVARQVGNRRHGEGMSAAQPIALQAVRGFHVGGHPVDLTGQPLREITAVPGLKPRVSDPNGRYLVGQLYVQHFELVKPRSPYPLLMWHGGGMTGAAWEQTPDGRPGWHDYFMRAGYDTYVSDSVERGRASWPPSAIVADSPEHRTVQQTWDIFRFGEPEGYDPVTGLRRGFDGQQFPVDHVDDLARQLVARWTSNSAMALAAYGELIRRAGPCIIIAHSEGARVAQEAALAMPELVKALVLIEPAGGPALDSAEASRLRHIPHCVLWGDFFAEGPLWQRYRLSAERWFDAVESHGRNVDVFDLPKMGISGNSHLMMMDKNNLQIAEMIEAWISHRALS